LFLLNLVRVYICVTTVVVLDSQYCSYFDGSCFLVSLHGCVGTRVVGSCTMVEASLFCTVGLALNISFGGGCLIVFNNL
jgi:hypothetical protein